MKNLSGLITAGVLSAMTVIAGGCSVVKRHDAHEAAVRVLTAPKQTPFPSGFLGHPLSYAAAVFGQLTIFSVSMAVGFFMLAHLNIKRDGCVHQGVRTWKSPVNVYRIAIMLFMMATAFWSSSNLLIYLSWNEVTYPPGLMTVYTIEKTLKALVAVPFLASIYLLIANNEVITTQLVMYTCEPLWPDRHEVKRHAWMMVWVFLLSAGVTYAKWGAYVAL